MGREGASGIGRGEGTGVRVQPEHWVNGKGGWAVGLVALGLGTSSCRTPTCPDACFVLVPAPLHSSTCSCSSWCRTPTRR